MGRANKGNLEGHRHELTTARKRTPPRPERACTCGSRKWKHCTASLRRHRRGECQPRGADSVAGFAPAAAGLRARFARAMSVPVPETAR